MSRARNAVIILILCIIGAYSARKGPQLGLNMMAPEEIKDAVADNRAKRRARGLTLASGKSENLRGAPAGHALGTPNDGNTFDDIDEPPRGDGQGGIGTQSNNPGQNFAPPPPISPSEPEE
jgi:hypothetical protein